MLLDLLCQAHATEFLLDDQAGIGHVILVVPVLDEAETGEFVAAKCDDSFPFLDLVRKVFRAAARDSCSTNFRGSCHGLKDFIDILQVLRGSNLDGKLCIHC